MKKMTKTMTTALVCFLLVALTGNAQELTVTYRMTLNTQSPDLFKEANLPEEMRRSMAQAYRNVVLNYQLVYANGESELRLLPSKEKQEITLMGQTIDVDAAMAQQAKNVTYKNHTEGIKLDKQDFFGKLYLISSRLTTEPFVVKEGETKEILGFECKKAVSPDGKTTVWFTPHIPIADEPITTGLQGLVLEYDNGQQHYTATQIDDKAANVITKPTEGKEMTEDAFKKMVEERVEMLKRGNQMPM
jgi:GLPGLI family protein